MLPKIYTIIYDSYKILACLNIKSRFCHFISSEAFELQLQPMTFRHSLFDSENNYPIKPMVQLKAA